MATKLTFKQFFHVWTQQLLGWLTNKFDSIQIDTSHLATEANATANKNAIITAVNNAQPDLSSVAKQGDNPNATNTAILQAFGNIDFTTLAKEVQVKDGNDTVIAVSKAIQQTLGTAPAGSQMATAFAYLASIYESIVGTVSPDVPEGVADRLAAVMKFFGIYVDGDKIYVKGADPEHPEQIVPAEFMTDTEVTDELEDIMQALDTGLLQEVEYPEGSGTYMTKAQFITIQAMEEVNNIINPSQS